MMDPLKIVRAAAGHKAADVLREEADALLLKSRQTQFTAAMRLGGRHTEEGRKWLAEAEVLRINAKQLELEAAGARMRANLTAYHEATKMLKEARKARRQK